MLHLAACFSPPFSNWFICAKNHGRKSGKRLASKLASHIVVCVVLSTQPANEKEC